MTVTDMQEQMRVLLSLQELDRTLYRVRDEIQRLPEEKQRRRQEIERTIERREELEARLRELRTRIKEIEDVTTQQRQRMRKLEGEAASSRGDTALLVAYQHEIKSLKRYISEAEEEGLGLVDQDKELSEQRDALQEQIDAAEAEFAEYAGNVDRELDAAQSRKAELDEQRRERMTSELTPEVLDQYEKLIEARGGQAMAELEGRVCQGCYVSVPNNIYVRLARGRELITCPSCGRILYLRD